MNIAPPNSLAITGYYVQEKDSLQPPTYPRAEEHPEAGRLVEFGLRVYAGPDDSFSQEAQAAWQALSPAIKTQIEEERASSDPNPAGTLRHRTVQAVHKIIASCYKNQPWHIRSEHYEQTYGLNNDLCLIVNPCFYIDPRDPTPQKKAPKAAPYTSTGDLNRTAQQCKQLAERVRLDAHKLSTGQYKGKLTFQKAQFDLLRGIGDLCTLLLPDMPAQVGITRFPWEVFVMLAYTFATQEGTDAFTTGGNKRNCDLHRTWGLGGELLSHDECLGKNSLNPVLFTNPLLAEAALTLMDHSRQLISALATLNTRADWREQLKPLLRRFYDSWQQVLQTDRTDALKDAQEAYSRLESTEFGNTKDNYGRILNSEDQIDKIFTEQLPNSRTAKLLKQNPPYGFRTVPSISNRYTSMISMPNFVIRTTRTAATGPSMPSSHHRDTTSMGDSAGTSLTEEAPRGSCACLKSCYRSIDRCVRGFFACLKGICTALAQKIRRCCG